MQIKQQVLAQHIQKKIVPLYVLTGQDTYLLEEALITIRSAIKKVNDCDEKMLSIQSSEDWNILMQEANCYSLFSDAVLLNVLFDKKTFDASGKKILTEYLTSVNQRSFIIIKAPNVPAKQLQWLSSHEQVMVVVAYPMNADAMKNWIATQLRKNLISFDQQVPDLIHQYTQGNMLACAQVIEKIALSNTPSPTTSSHNLSTGSSNTNNTDQLMDLRDNEAGRLACKIGVTQALEHLSDQCEHSLFELIDACLLGHADKAIQILRHAANNKTESTLILWMLTQEVRVLLQLSYLVSQTIDVKTASSQLKVWPQRISLYQISMKRFNHIVLQKLLLYCQSIDERIKSSFNTQVWPSLESLALSLCLGQLIGDTCAV